MPDVPDLMNPPTPTALRLLRGNPHKKPLPQGEPHLAAVKLKRPSGLSRRAARIWGSFAAQLYTAGVSTAIDGAALRALVENYATWEEAIEAVRRDGIIIYYEEHGRWIPRRNPCLQIIKDAQADLTRLLVEFGMTPSSRTRVRSAATKPKEDAASALFGF